MGSHNGGVFYVSRHHVITSSRHHVIMSQVTRLHVRFIDMLTCDLLTC